MLDNVTDTAEADIVRAEGLAAQALAASPRSPLAHLAKGQVLRAQGRFEEAIPEYETIVASNRNWVFAISNLGQCKLFTGALDEVIPLQEQALRLSPRDPNIGVYYLRIGLVHLLQSRTDEAIIWLEKARGAMSGHPMPHAFLASVHALEGEIERAAAELTEARRLSGDDRYSSITHLKAAGYFGATAPGYFGAPKIRALFKATYFAGLRKAGMPEE